MKLQKPRTSIFKAGVTKVNPVDIDYIGHCNIIFVVDASDSMQGAKIGTVNSAIEELVPEIQDIAETNGDAEIGVNVLKISDSVRWLYKGICSAGEFKWHNIHAGGSRNIGMALNELNRQMSYEGFFVENKNYFKPIVFFLTDGSSEDDYREPLELLKQNYFFNRAIRIGVAIGRDADRSFLTEFTDCADRVITVHTPEAILKTIQFVPLNET